MLSKLLEERDLGAVDGYRRRFIGFVQPPPEIPVTEKMKPEHGHQVRERPGEGRSETEVLEEQDGDQCCPNLNQESVFRGAHEGLDLEVLFQRLEKDLHLPPVLVHRGDGYRRKGKVIREKDDGNLLLRVEGGDPSQATGVLLPG